MRRPLQYESKPVRSEPSPESRRKAYACFACSGALGLLGLGLIAFAVWSVFAARQRPIATTGRNEGRLAAYLGVLGVMTIGAAIERANAGFYHLSGFEDRRSRR